MILLSLCTHHVENLKVRELIHRILAVFQGVHFVGFGTLLIVLKTRRDYSDIQNNPLHTEGKKPY